MACYNSTIIHVQVVVTITSRGGKAYQGSEKYGQGNGTILMDDLMCAGDESSLFDCPFNGWGVSNCGHGEDAGVQCVMPVTSMFVK